MKTQKTVQVQVLAIYRWKAPISRICFEIESSDGSQKYSVCFSGDTAHSSCTCEGHSVWHKTCRHITGLTAKAQEYFQPAQPVQPEKANPVAAAEAFINRVVAEKAAKAEKLARGAVLMKSGTVTFVSGCIRSDASPLHNNVAEHKLEAAPSGRLVPMR